MKKPISTKTHGILDYTVGPFVAMSPWLLGYGKKSELAKWLPVALGAGSVVYSLFTRYEMGVKPVLSMKNHLRMDTASGLMTAGAPWLFGFAKKTFIPMLLLGLVELAVVALSQSEVPEQQYDGIGTA
jgi:hypothetical protein